MSVSSGLSTRGLDSTATSRHRVVETRAAWRVALVGAIVLGVVLRVWQYWASTSLWLDEAAVARNVLDRDIWPLLASPMAYGQVAPPGWLFLVDLSASLFGPGERSLRVVPMIGGILLLPATYILARRILTEAGAVAVTVMLALATPLTLFSSNLKPYSTDAFLAVMLLLAGDAALRATLTLRSAIAFALAGLIAVLLSASAVFVLAAAGGVLVLDGWRRADCRWRLTIVAAWALSAGAAVWWGRRSMSPVDAAFMNLYWAAGFAPQELSAIPKWVWNSLNTLSGATGNAFQGNLKYAFTGPVVAVMIAGSLLLAWRDWRRSLLLTGPVLLVIAAAALHQYPFRGRLLLFLLPLLLLLAVTALDTVARLVHRPWVAATIPFLLVPTAVQAVDNRLPPRFVEHLRPVVEYVQQQRQPGDAIWVYYGAGMAFRYYQHLMPLDGRVSVCDREHPRGQIEQIDALRGTPRVWVIVTHTAIGSGDERAGLLNYLDRIGTRKDVFPATFTPNASGAAAFAFLYDLSDTDRLRSASSASFPIPETRTPRWSCYGTLTPDENGLREASAAVRAAAATTRGKTRQAPTADGLSLPD